MPIEGTYYRVPRPEYPLERCAWRAASCRWWREAPSKWVRQAKARSCRDEEAKPPRGIGSPAGDGLEEISHATPSNQDAWPGSGERHERLLAAKQRSLIADTSRIMTTPSRIRVDHAACARLASLLRTHSIPEPQEDIQPPDLPRELIGNFFLAAVAICHQTSPIGRPPLEGIIGGTYAHGWDFLIAKLKTHYESDPQLLAPSVLAQITGADIRTILHDQKYGDRITDPEGRAAILRDLGQTMLTRGWSGADQIYLLCDRRLALSSPNLLDTLSQFRAYRDPVRKKSLFFLSLMKSSGMWSYVDDEHLWPPIDYHEIRGHLRIGTVQIVDQTIESKIRKQIPLTEEEDAAVREKVLEAILEISASTSHDPTRLHYLFWNIFRAICTRSSPQCLSLKSEVDLPQRYMPLTAHSNGPRRCPFEPICVSAHASEKPVEPTVNIDYY